jgi:hypothetical protein
VLKRPAGRAGLDPAEVAGHSLRAGLATSAAAAGVPGRVIAEQTGPRARRCFAATSARAPCFVRMPPVRLDCRGGWQGGRCPKAAQSRGYGAHARRTATFTDLVTIRAESAHRHGIVASVTSALRHFPQQSEGKYASWGRLFPAPCVWCSMR